MMQIQTEQSELTTYETNLFIYREEKKKKKELEISSNDVKL